ncbi:RNA-guided endonuclease TnpB family protein [Streptomyces solisilvae]|uniref:RNA-guided endonuclease TnpB family protein n=1 Tax=Streptomyces malaysiensis TaxID=92644 RepID=UPI0036C90A1A
MAEQTVLRAYRFALDPGSECLKKFAQHAGAARWAYNWALAVKAKGHQAYTERIAALTDLSLPEAEAKEAAKLAFREEGAELHAELKRIDASRKALFNAVKGRRPGEKGVIAERLGQLRRDLEGIQGAVESAEASGDEAAVQKLAKAAATLTQERTTLLRMVTELPNDLTRIRKRLAQLREAVTELQARRFTAGHDIAAGTALAAHWRTIRDLPSEKGGSPWHTKVNPYAVTEAFTDADAAWKNWIESLRGRRKGRRVGYPRFKKKGRARDSFRLCHNVKSPTIRFETYRRLRLASLGEVRLHHSAKRLVRMIDRGHAKVQSVTVSRAGNRWYASVLCKVQQVIPDKPSRAQIQGGTVGVHLGVNPLATLSKPWPGSRDIAHSTVDNPRILDRAAARIVKVQRAYARTKKGSARRAKTAALLGPLHHRVAEQRAERLHQLTKRLATGFETVSLYDLDVAGLTASPKRSRKRHASSDLNRRILDAAPGETRCQLSYKTLWYGSRLAILARDSQPSKTCSACGQQNPRLTLADRVFHCRHCNLKLPRGVNAARNIAANAVVPRPDGDAIDLPYEGDVKTARRAPIRPASPGETGTGQ